ncbi:hypothetical protein HF086_002117 [Spodoptera exigua]|uniref:Uncharacterized protein n=1 Tax=Spodoptera exigua TaxID=7107 RepID=A0A922MMK7_SPOEX|nr:hypothetical protein HF086_002117 [Spodoptera exigua]
MSTLINVYFFPQTPFVRQNTPHPKDLKAKAQKLLAGRSPEVAALQAAKQEQPTTNGISMISPPDHVLGPVETEPEYTTQAAPELTKEEDSDTQTAADRESSEGENDENEDSDELEAIKKREQQEEPKTDDEETAEDTHDGECHINYIVLLGN